MKNIKVVIGANFGDEGKGLLTNYFCLQEEKEVLNVRFNGTCQAGHTVVTEDKRHVFSHFGAGSFNSNAVSYLSSYFYVNPVLFNSEYDKLVALGVKPIVKICRNSPVVLIFDVLYNRYIENSRSKNRHGSCGLGLWEAWLREQAMFNITVDDLQKGRHRLFKQIQSIRNDYYTSKFSKDNLDCFDTLEVEGLSWFDDLVIELFIEECKVMLSRVEIVDEEDVLNKYSYLVFEGAQGLLLDWDNREYMPNLTASRTGLYNVKRLLDKIVDAYSLEVCYVTRSYFTRHGAGKFLTEVKDKIEIGVSADDKTNGYNTWQEQFRYGYFDLELFKKSIFKDLSNLNDIKYEKSIAITHLDETHDFIKLKEKDLHYLDFMAIFKDCGVYLSRSEESKRVEKLK